MLPEYADFYERKLRKIRNVDFLEQLVENRKLRSGITNHGLSFKAVDGVLVPRAYNTYAEDENDQTKGRR